MSFPARAPLQLPFVLALTLAASGMAACGDAASHPDTGYGANQPVPATINCTDVCTRGADCVAELCNEDTMSTNYTAGIPTEIAGCESACTSSTLAVITTADWQCFFTSSCRQVFQDNVCHTANTHYGCN